MLQLCMVKMQKQQLVSGGCHEACSGAYAFLFWDRNDASFVYSGDAVHTDFYYRVPDVGVLSVLRVRSVQPESRKCRIQKVR